MFILLFILIGLEAVGELLGLALKKQWAGYLVISSLCTVWLVFYQLPLVQQKMSYYLKYGAPGYNSIRWQKSPTINWLKRYQLPGKIYSNDIHPIYIHTKLSPRFSLRKIDNAEEFKKSISSGKNYLIWFHSYWPGTLYDFKELNSMFRLKPVLKQPDSLIFEMYPK